MFWRRHTGSHTAARSRSCVMTLEDKMKPEWLFTTWKSGQTFYTLVMFSCYCRLTSKPCSPSVSLYIVELVEVFCFFSTAFWKGKRQQQTQLDKQHVHLSYSVFSILRLCRSRKVCFLLHFSINKSWPYVSLQEVFVYYLCGRLDLF